MSTVKIMQLTVKKFRLMAVMELHKEEAEVSNSEDLDVIDHYIASGELSEVSGVSELFLSVLVAYLEHPQCICDIREAAIKQLQEEAEND